MGLGGNRLLPGRLVYGDWATTGISPTTEDTLK